MTREDVLLGLVKATPEGMLSHTTRVCGHIKAGVSAAAVRRELAALAADGFAKRVEPFDRGRPERWAPTPAGREAVASSASRPSEGSE